MEPLAELLGESPGVVAVREQVRRLLQRQSDARRMPPVLIQGETGTGKGLLARALHDASARSRGPFVDVNCAAIPETLLESEMFGVERGAFTDARQPKAGLFQTAHRGTLFLDEVALLPEGLQAKLLKAIEEREVRRLGAIRSESVDVWVIAATNEALAAAVQARRFRADLYHRLAVVTIALPPLRERGDDVLLLAEHFLARACADYGIPAMTLTAGARDTLLAYDWPGNIRELANVLERVALLGDVTRVTAEDLGLPRPSAGSPVAAAAARPVAAPAAAVLAPPEGAEGEREWLLRALEETGWNVTRAAALLGVSRNTLRYRMEKHNLRPGAAAARRAPLAAEPVSAAAAVPAAVVGAPAEPEPVVEPEPAIAASPPAATTERRRLAFLAVVLAPRTSAPAPPARVLEHLGEKVRIFGGRVDEGEAGRLVAVFGLDPVEDAARRAANAALAMRRAVERDTAWTCRAGIHLAEGLVERPAEGAPRLDEGTRRAALAGVTELLEVVEAGAIGLSEAARPFLERRFDLLPLAGAARAWRLGGPERAGLEAGRRMAALVGRAQELALLESLLDAAVRGQGQVVGIAGEPGIGKSRLVAEFCERLASRSIPCVEGRCLSYGSEMAYVPVLDVVRALLGIADSDTPEVVGDRVRAGLEADGTGAETARYLLHLLGIKADDEVVESLDPETLRARTLEALRALCVGRSRRHPLVIVIEDLHWIDRASDDCLAALVDALATARILLVATYRPGYRPPWIGRSWATQVALRALAADESLRIVRAVLGDRAVPDGLLARVIEKGEGNPFFLEELARALRDGGDGEGPAVPDTVEEVVLARIDWLPHGARHVLNAAAVVGKDVPLGLLEAVADLPPDDLQRALRALGAAEFLLDVGAGGEPAYTFKHALTHEVAYGSLPEDERRLLHARALAALERQHTARLAEQVETLAHHAVRAALPDKAVAYLGEAGARALARGAHREAAACIEQALGVLGQPETRASRERAVDLRFELRNALQPLGEFVPILAHLREAERLARLLGDRRRLGRVYAYLTDYLRLTGDQTAAIDVGQRALAIAEALGDFTLQVETNTWLGQVHYARGDYRGAIAFFSRNVAALVGDRQHERFGLPQHPSIHSRTCLAWCLAEIGDFAEGRRRAEEAVHIAEAAATPLGRTVACAGLGVVHLRQGAFDEAIRVLQPAVELTLEAGIPLWFPRVASGLGLALVHAGRVGEGLPLLEQAAERARSMHLFGGYAMLLAALAEGQAQAGRLEEAAAGAGRALALSREHRERGLEAWTLRLLGAIASRAEVPDLAEGEVRFLEAMALASELGMRPLLAHCRLGVGRLHLRAGDRAIAAEELSLAANLFDALGMPAWRDRALALRGSA